MSEEFTPEQVRQVLDLELGENDSGQPTVRGYLLRLLADVWREGEGFDGKRPFGNSSWECDLYAPMVRARLVEGALDSDGYLERCDEKAANALILAAIMALDVPREAPEPGPQPAKVIVVTEVRSAGMTGERCFPASEIRHHPDAGTIELYRDGRRIAFYNRGTWLNFRDHDAEGPDGTARALGIAKQALEEIQDEPHAGFGPERARTALDDIAELDL